MNKIAQIVRALLAKASSTTNEHEAEAKTTEVTIMNLQDLKDALVCRGYALTNKNYTRGWLCYQKDGGVPRSRAVVWVNSSTRDVLCGETLLTAEPSPEFKKALLGEYTHAGT